MSAHHASHSHSAQVDEHTKELLIKLEMAQRLEPFFEKHQTNLIGSFVHWVQHLVKGHHHIHHFGDPDFHQPDHEKMSRKELINRTVYALKKIKEINHDYFSPEETRVLSAVNPSFGTRAWCWGVKGAYGVYLSFMIVRRVTALRPWLLAAIAFPLIQVDFLIPNLVNEFLQNKKRRVLAARYLDYYGPGYVQAVLNPNTSVLYIERLKNNLDK